MFNRRSYLGFVPALLLSCGAALAQSTLYWSGAALNPNTGGAGNWNQVDAHWSTSAAAYTPATWMNGQNLNAVLGGSVPGIIIFTPPGISGSALTVAQNHTLNTGGSAISFATLTFTGAGTNLTVLNGSFAAAMTAGTVTLGGAATMTVGGSWPVSGGRIVAKESATVAVAPRSSNTGSTELELQDYARIQLVGGALAIGGLLSDSPHTVIENGNSIRESSFTVSPSAGTSTYAGIMRDSAAGPQTYGTLTFVKGGAGTLVLSGTTKTYSGATTIIGGTLRMGSANVLPTTTSVFFNSFYGTGQWDLAGHNQTIGALAETLGAYPAGSIQLGAATLTLGAGNKGGGFSGAISGTGAIIKLGAGGQTLGGANTYSGGTTVQAGIMNATSKTAFGTGPVVFKPGTTLGVGTATLDSNITLESGEVTLAPSFSNAELTGVLGGAALLDVKAASTVRLSGANTFSGGLRLSGGTVEVAADSALGAPAGAIHFNGGGLHLLQPSALDPTRALVLGGANGTISANSSMYSPLTLANHISGTGNLTIGRGTVLLTGQNSFRGRLQISSDATLGVMAHALGDPANGIDVSPRGTFRAIEDLLIEPPRTMRISGFTPGATLSVDADKALILTVPLERSSPSTTVLRKDGPGTLMLTKPSTFGGRTEILQGILTLTGGVNLLPEGQPVHIATGALALFEAEQTLGTLSGYGTTLLLDSVLRLSGGDATYPGVFTGDGTVIKLGTGTLTTDGASSLTGRYDVAAGTWAQRGMAGTESLTRVLTGARLSGSGQLGRLEAQSGGTIAPGTAVGSLTALATTLSGGARVEVDFKNSTLPEGSGWDVLRIDGPLTLNATPADAIVIRLVSRTAAGAAGPAAVFDGASPATFRIIRTGGISGFQPGAIVVDASAFENAPRHPFRVRLAKGGMDLLLVHAPLDYAEWSQDRFSSEELAGDGIGQAMADADGDQLANLVEYALGTDPRRADAPMITIAAHDEEWRFDYARPSGRTVNCQVEISTDLTQWTTAGVVHERIQTGSDGRDIWRARVPRSVGSTVFMRIGASLP